MTFDATQPLVSVLRHRYVRGWPKHASGEHVSILALDVALATDHRTDAHFTAYVTRTGRRLNTDAVDHGIAPELHTAAFDVDCLEAHRANRPAPADWRAATLERFEALVRVHPGLLLYMTRGGARIVGRLAQPMVIRTRSDARRWSQQYGITAAYLARRFGLDCDLECSDWTRLYRCPRATRDRQHGPETWPLYGDPRQLGILQIDCAPCDIEAARRTRPNVFGAPRAARVLEYAPTLPSGFGLLYHLLASRGSIVREHASNTFVVRCPNEAAHTTGRTGDGSTLLYPPAAGAEIGAIHCKHMHCGGLRCNDWLRMFDDHELESARHAAGIARVT